MESAERARRSARAPAGGNVGSDNVRVRSGWPQTLVSSDLDMSQERNGLIIIPDAVMPDGEEPSGSILHRHLPFISSWFQRRKLPVKK
jgi:hypothetical protein